MGIFKHGKNILDLTKHTNTLSSNTTVTANSITCECTNTWQGRVVAPLELEKNTEYTISCNADSNATSAIISKISGIKDGISTSLVNAQYFGWFRNGYRFNSGDYDRYELDIYIRGNRGENGHFVLDQLQIEAGNSKTTYEPYNPKVKHIAAGSKNVFPFDILHLTPIGQQEIDVETIYDSDIKKRVLHLKDNGGYPSVKCKFPQRLKRGAYYDIRIKYKAISTGWSIDFWMFPSWSGNQWDNLGAWNNGNSKLDNQSDRTFWSTTNGYEVHSKRFRVNEDKFDSDEYAYRDFLFSLGYGNNGKEIWIADISLVEITEEEWEQTEFTPPPYEPYYNIARVYQGENLVFSDILPDELQECEYIQSTGTQYIDTGVILGQNDNFNINTTSALLEKSIGENPLCSNWASIYNYWNFFANQNKVANLYTNGHHTGATLSLGQKYKFGINRVSSMWGYSVDNSILSWQYTPTTDNPTTVKIFARGDLNSANFGHWRVYNFNIDKNSVLIRNFIPCYIKTGQTFVDEKGNTCSAGTPGLYDRANGVFYTNSGTGTFSVGGDV